MAAHEIENVERGATFTSYVGSAHAVLRAADLYDGDTTALMGLSGFAFHFHINPGVCPSSATEFPWVDRAVLALDRLGVVSEAFQSVSGLNCEDEMRARAIGRIRESIDRGVGAVVWAPSPVLEFGVLRGYDDAERTFSVVAYGPPGTEPDPLLYDNLGRGEVPILFYQIAYGRRDVDLERSERQSLELAVQLWRPSPQHPGRGQTGYAVMLDALERQDFVPFGVAYNLWLYAEAKRHAHAYVSRLCDRRRVPGLEPARDAYAEVADKLSQVSQRIPFRGPASSVDPSVLPEVIGLVKECAAQEDRARNAIASALGAAA